MANDMAKDRAGVFKYSSHVNSFTRLSEVRDFLEGRGLTDELLKQSIKKSQNIYAEIQRDMELQFKLNFSYFACDIHAVLSNSRVAHVYFEPTKCVAVQESVPNRGVTVKDALRKLQTIASLNGKTLNWFSTLIRVEAQFSSPPVDVFDAHNCYRNSSYPIRYDSNKRETEYIEFLTQTGRLRDDTLVNGRLHEIDDDDWYAFKEHTCDKLYDYTLKRNLKVRISCIDFLCDLEALVTSDSSLRLKIDEYFIERRFIEGASPITEISVTEAHEGDGIKVVDVVSAMNSLPVDERAGTYLEGLVREPSGKYSFNWGT